MSNLGKLTNALRTGGKRPSSQRDVELAEWSFYLSAVRPGTCVFDVGAYVGEVALLFARLVGPSGVVHAFEPTPESFARLQQIVAASGRNNIQANNCAVGRESGTVPFFVYGVSHSSWNGFADRPLANYGIEVEAPRATSVPAISLDAYCSTRGIDRVDLLKIDVEGAELDVLLGASSLFHHRAVKTCVFEFGQTTFDAGHRPEELESFFRSMGYRVRNLVAGQPPYPGGSGAASAQYSMHVATPRD